MGVYDVNVLSIDWDFFLKLGNRARMYLPDVTEHSTNSPELSIFLWGTWYATLKKMTRESGTEVELNEDAISSVIKTVQKCCQDAEFFYIEDHGDIYDILAENEGCKFNIVNIDQHHDCYLTCMYDLNCGNWVRYLYDDGFISSYTWITNENYKDYEKDFPEWGTKITENPLEFIQGMFYDYVFLCKSPEYVPPEFDSRLNDLCKVFEHSCRKTTYTSKLCVRDIPVIEIPSIPSGYEG